MKNRSKIILSNGFISLGTKGKTKVISVSTALTDTVETGCKAQASKSDNCLSDSWKGFEKTFAGMCFSFCGQSFWDLAETRFLLKTYMVFITP